MLINALYEDVEGLCHKVRLSVTIRDGGRPLLMRKHMM